jgi:hypothetical protein
MVRTLLIMADKRNVSKNCDGYLNDVFLFKNVSVSCSSLQVPGAGVAQSV